MGLFSNQPADSFAQLKRWYHPSNFVLEKPAQFYDFPACLSGQLYIHIMGNIGVSRKERTL
eukprot:5831498-Prorocentrum_lima.AAC.1